MRTRQHPKTHEEVNSIIRFICYPVLLLSGTTTVFLALAYQLDFSLCSIVFLIWTIAYLTVMEKLIPYETHWHPTRKEWLRDGIYLLITMIGGGAAVGAAFYIATLFIPITSTMPLWIEALLAILLSSLLSYIFHRISHVHPWLWLLHGIHHVENKVNVGNNGVNHVLDVFCRRLLAQLPLLLLGISQSALFVAGIFATVQGYFVHANINVRLGWLNYILVGPEQHRLHHSDDLSEAGHYSVDIPLWDLLFKSFTWRPGHKPHGIGVVEPAKFPKADDIFVSLLHPWRRKTY